jgi:hypothetical protein
VSDEDRRAGDVLEQDVARLIGSALAVPARPLSYRNASELTARVALRSRPAYSGWALLACAVCLLAMTIFGLLPDSAAEELRLLALLVPAANLLLAPLAAWAIVKRGRSAAPAARQLEE